MHYINDPSILLGRQPGKKMTAWVAWNIITQLKHLGGLRFRDMKVFNLALLSRQAWRLLQNCVPRCFASSLARVSHLHLRWHHRVRGTIDDHYCADEGKVLDGCSTSGPSLVGPLMVGQAPSRALQPPPGFE